ncbi:hypothetical protein [Nocardioides anomalus]|nr:hypothetical protein [Nocardioides anomalus]
MTVPAWRIAVILVLGLALAVSALLSTRAAGEDQASSAGARTATR